MVDVLVLGAGGILGEAWLNGVLSGLGDAGGFDARDCRRLLGTSAGSIVAAALAAGVSPADRLGRIREQPAMEDDRRDGDGDGAGRRALEALGSVAGAAVTPVAALALSSTA